MLDKMLKKVLAIIPVFLLVLSLNVYANQDGYSNIEPNFVEIVFIDGVRHIEVEGRMVPISDGNYDVTSSRHGFLGTFNLNDAVTSGLRRLMQNNNLFNRNLRITPVAFGPGITSVDILVTGSGMNPVHFTSVSIMSSRNVIIPWNAGNVSIYVQTRGANGAVAINIVDN
ncbi:MAG: hypothetical protein FWF57_02155 [Defluviitaleaceae bacterium]|nr:hypothetical protein [Defluviitaleaceae bacterium]